MDEGGRLCLTVVMDDCAVASVDNRYGILWRRWRWRWRSMAVEAFDVFLQKQATLCPLCTSITAVMNTNSVATVGDVVPYIAQVPSICLRPSARFHRTVPLLLEKHERQEGFLFLVIGQGFHLNWTKHVHVVHLSELFCHSCFALRFKLLIPAFIK